MRTPYLLIVAVLAHQANAQLSNPDLKAMVAAEEAFIKMAREKNTRDAFLYFLSDDAITAGTDGPKKGKDDLKKSPVSGGLLHWAVAYCDIASSGDMGYNTAPWAFRAQPTDVNPVAFGEFHSIWKKQPDGTWKNILDIGIRHGEAPTAVQPVTTDRPLRPAASTKNNEKPGVATIAALEKRFINEFAVEGNDAFIRYGSAELRLSREGMLPFTTPAAVSAYLKNGLVPRYTFLDGGIAASGDLGYAYGTAAVSVSTERDVATKKATYLRVWKKEDTDWKIVLDVLTYQ